MCDYVIFAPGSRKFVAFPVASSRQAISLIPSSTRKKVLLKAVLYATQRIRLPFPPFSYSNQIEIFPGLTIDSLARDLCFSDLSPERVLILWNRDSRRRRAYLWFYDRTGVTLAFAKVVIGYNERLALQNEKITLEFLESRQLRFSVPRNIGYIEQIEYTALVTTAIPKVIFKTLSWEDVRVVSEELFQINMKVVPGSSVFKKKWFIDIGSEISFNSLEIIKDSLQSSSVKTCFIHGDFGSENIYLHNGKLWVIDWEKSCDEGPVLTDMLAHWIGGCRWGVDTAKLISAFQRFFATYAKEDVLLGVLYLASMKFPPAEAVVKAWDVANFKFLK
jgi:hypothetical protein